MTATADGAGHAKTWRLSFGPSVRSPFAPDLLGFGVPNMTLSQDIHFGGSASRLHFAPYLRRSERPETLNDCEHGRPKL